MIITNKTTNVIKTESPVFRILIGSQDNSIPNSLVLESKRIQNLKLQIKTKKNWRTKMGLSNGFDVVEWFE